MACISCTYVDPSSRPYASKDCCSPRMVGLAHAIYNTIISGAFVIAILGACNVVSARTVSATFLGMGGTAMVLAILVRDKHPDTVAWTIHGIILTILGAFGKKNSLSGKGMSHWFLGIIISEIVLISCVTLGRMAEAERQKQNL